MKHYDIAYIPKSKEVKLKNESKDEALKTKAVKKSKNKGETNGG